MLEIFIHCIYIIVILIIFTCFYVDHVTCQSMEYLLKDWTRHCILYVKHVVYIFLKGCLKRYDLLVVILKLIGVNLCLLVCFYRKHLSIACKIHCLFFRYYFKMIFFFWFYLYSKYSVLILLFINKETQSQNKNQMRKKLQGSE